MHDVFGAAHRVRRVGRQDRAACSFFAWLDENVIAALDVIEPLHVSFYIERLQTTAAKPTVK